MTINFDNIKLEGDAEKAALETLKGNEVFTQYVSEAVTNRENAVRQTLTADVDKYKGKLDEFRKNNVDLAKKLEAFEGFDADEYKRLKALGSDANAANEQIKSLKLDYEAKLEGANGKIRGLTEASETLKQEHANSLFKIDVQNAISKHNQQFKGHEAIDGAEQIIIDKAMSARKMAGDKLIMMDGDKEFTTDSGIGSLSDWIGSVARRDYPFLFNKPTGSGAAGSNSGGAGAKTMTRQEFNGITDPVRKSEVGRTYTITD